MKRRSKRLLCTWLVAEHKPRLCVESRGNSRWTIAARDEPTDPLEEDVCVSAAAADAYHLKLLEMDDGLSKYYAQRYDLFELYDGGVLLDAESWYSVTPEAIARHHARKILSRLLSTRFNISLCDVVPEEKYWTLSDDELTNILESVPLISSALDRIVVVDGFCGAGGNTIQFARTFKHVVAIDIDPVKMYLAKHNTLKVYQIPATRVRFCEGDYFDILPKIGESLGKPSDASLAMDHAGQVSDTSVALVVYLSPPWGGPAYQQSRFYDPARMLENIGLERIVHEAAQLTPDLAIFLPKNTPRKYFSVLADRLHRSTARNLRNPPSITVEENYLNDRLKALTVYYGGLATQRSHVSPN
jgi:trimethylguanosine synthase